MCSGSEADSYLRLIDFVYHTNLGLRVIKKKQKGTRTRGRDADDDVKRCDFRVGEHRLPVISPNRRDHAPLQVLLPYSCRESLLVPHHVRHHPLNAGGVARNSDGVGGPASGLEHWELPESQPKRGVGFKVWGLEFRV